MICSNNFIDSFWGFFCMSMDMSTADACWRIRVSYCQCKKNYCATSCMCSLTCGMCPPLYVIKYVDLLYMTLVYISAISFLLSSTLIVWCSCFLAACTLSIVHRLTWGILAPWRELFQWAVVSWCHVRHHADGLDELLPCCWFFFFSCTQNATCETIFGLDSEYSA